MIVSKRNECSPFVTKDGSSVRELMHPDAHHNKSQSIAEAVVSPGQQTASHKHAVSEELYLITQGNGLIEVGGEQCNIETGDTVAIPANTFHSIMNTGTVDLVIICACAPAYLNADTVLAVDEK